MEFSAHQIAAFLNGIIDGNPDVKVNNFSKIEEGSPGTITFLGNPKYEHFIYTTNADIVLVNKDFKPSTNIKATLVRVDNAYSALAILLNIVEQSKPKKQGIEANAFVDPSASLGNDCYVGSFAYISKSSTIGNNCLIYPSSFIGENVVVGDDTIIYPNVTIYDNCKIGKNCILHAGCVIGSDGFGFALEGEAYKKIAQLGNVDIKDNVEIGANTTIDRAVMGSTIIHSGVKLDNLIQIGHNVEIGESTVMAAQVGIAGSTKVGAHCSFGGQVGLGGHIQIGDEVKLGAQSGVIQNIDSKSTLIGSPAINPQNFFRSSIIYAKLPDMYKELHQLKKEIEKLKKQYDADDNA